MYMDERPKRPFGLQGGTRLRWCKNWDAEAALRMLRNNLHPRVAYDWEKLIVYGGSGRAARNWHEFHRIVRALKSLNENETLCIQSGKPVYIAPTHKDAPRVIIANSNLVPAWATDEHFDYLDKLGLMMYGQMTAGSWIYIGTQGILQGTYETFRACAEQHFGGNLRGKFVLTAGLGAMSGAQALAATMNGAAVLVVEVRREKIEQKVKEGYCDFLETDLFAALVRIRQAITEKKAISVGLVGNAAEIYPELVSRDVIPDIVTDQTPAHNLLFYVPVGNLEQLDELRHKDSEAYRKEALHAIYYHVDAIIDMQKRGAIAFDYGNALRDQACKAGLSAVRKPDGGQFVYPGFVPAYIRPLFCEGKGPFRWAALSGDPHDILTIDKAIFKLFPHDEGLKNWIRKVQSKVPFIGLPTRICWLGCGDRVKLGLLINHLVKTGRVKAPIVIGRDHLDCGSVASPSRETEGMIDGSDAIADWPLLNFALNAVNGASWVSFHHGGGVGMGMSLHAGMVIVCDGTKERDERIERVLAVDPGLGVARHADAGYEIAWEVARKKGVKIPK
ncbi:urocanate hydratase [Candidatus Falkowbacteria bacterium]|nr:urocanate hydratase [Candidatus Falkowbacteria bacterium]